ncbi:MAG: MFS transporter [Candidatus Omnitrophica bacterium]|nr:MFS transporter [Candidatus Omnitrophota bacterium]
MDKTCKSKPFKALMVSQFSSAFNDNCFKIIISLLAIKTLSSEESAAKFVSFIGFLFIAPFMIISPYAGILADRFSKRSIIIVMEGVKVFNMLLASFAFLSGNLWLLSGVLFLLVLESALFSPAKYGILPEILKEEELSRGNGFIQMWTFVAVISGIVLGGKCFDLLSGRLVFAGMIMLVVALAGFSASFLIKTDYAPEGKKSFNVNFVAEAMESFSEVKKDKGLFLTMLGLAYFSFLSAVFQMNILIYGSHVLSLPQSKNSLLLAFVLCGIAVGGVLAGKLSDKKVELGLVPVGALGMCYFCSVLGIYPGNFFNTSIFLSLLGISAGFYTVPLNAFYQRYSPLEKRGKFLAASNIFGSIATLIASIFIWFFAGKLKVNAAAIFTIIGLVSVFTTAYIVSKLPDALIRLLNLLIAHSIYKLKVVGSENIPDKGGALIVANHISFVDGVLIQACLKRPVRFIINKDMYELPCLKPICRAMRAISIDQKSGPKAILKVLHEARDAVNQGDLVCIFPEGHLSRTGNMLPFYKGFEVIMKDLTAPIIPLYLDNVWGSIFSYADGKYFWKFPKSTRYPVSLVFGKQLSSGAKAYQIRTSVQELGAEANMLRGLYRQKLHLSFINEVKRHTFCFCMADSSGLKLRYFEVLAAALSFSRTLFPPYRRPKETNEMVGVLLPSSCIAAIANLSVCYAGKVPVNLNFTLSAEAFSSCVKQCNMKTIITSRIFIGKIGMSEAPGMVFVEDIKDKISRLRQIFLAVCSVILPGYLLRLIFVEGDKKNVDDVATVIFSSGSTGEPKGVMLTHANIFSNIESFYQVFDMRHNDIVMAALPFFHSFGFTATLCFPIGTGLGVVYHANPVDASTIGKLVMKYRATMIMGTPTFISSYLRKCTPEQFASLRRAVVGAEKLKEPLARAFYEKFKVMPFEGYGATELSPIVTVGFPDYYNEETKERQLGHKIGKVGHPIPGVAVKVVDPETFEVKGYDEEGLLMVKGANVMKGYLNNPSKTAEVIKEGWYITGDIATIDPDGFVKITDRLSRFSKIGGEMVPHIKIEENIMEVVGCVEPVIAVTSVPDERKGERLAVLHSIDIDAEEIVKALAQKGLPNLWIPKKESFFRVEAIPLLGTGKSDLKKIKSLADELSVKIPAASSEEGQP